MIRVRENFSLSFAIEVWVLLAISHFFKVLEERAKVPPPPPPHTHILYEHGLLINTHLVNVSPGGK